MKNKTIILKGGLKLVPSLKPQQYLYNFLWLILLQDFTNSTEPTVLTDLDIETTSVSYVETMSVC